MTYQCKYCGKVYKTEKGLFKHESSCPILDRYTYLNNSKCFQRWLMFKTVSKLKVNKDIEKEKENFIYSPLYKHIEKFSKWCDDMEMFDERAYLEYVINFNVPVYKWCNDRFYERFIINYINNELPSIAIERSKKYLQSLGLTLETISANRLYMLLLSGKISKKYLQFCNFNANMRLDGGQIKILGNLI